MNNIFIGNNADVDEAKELSSLIKNTLNDNPLANYASISLREFLINTIETNEPMDTIDVFLRTEEDSVVISVKDPGIERNENFTFENNESDFTRNIKHSRILGLNSTEITIVP